jgi:DNA-binding NarL/FixJ family response regulator
MKEKLKTGSEKVRLLIVDDSATVRDSVTRLCSLNPRLEVVGQAKDGVEALAAIRKLKPDVVTLDLRMPNLGGLEVLQAVRDEIEKMVVIVLTARNEEFYRQKCFELGARHVFDKSGDFEPLLHVLRSL